MNGGNIDDIVTEIMIAMVDSGFFQALLSPEEREDLKKDVQEMKETLKK